MPDHPHSRPLARRTFLGAGALTLAGAGIDAACRSAAGNWDPAGLPDEPLDIGTLPQFLFDLHVVDCTWTLKEKHDPVQRVFHAGQKHPGNPLLTGDQPSHFWVVRDADSGLFRLWYQLNQALGDADQRRQKGTPAYRAHVAYAQSRDGLAWERPKIEPSAPSTEDRLPPNVVLPRADAPQIVTLPEQDRRGYRYGMFYHQAGPGGSLRLVGSHDGLHWDNDRGVALSDIRSDHHNTIIYDPLRRVYVMYLRAKHLYLAPGLGRERLDSGQSRRGVARMTSKQLWSAWNASPQTILMPDELDSQRGYHYFYGMPVAPYAGIYWGFLQAFRLNDFMHAELAWSRDGIHFQRLPQRPKLLEYGPDGAWDDTMILACPQWIEMGDQWWVYYNGWDGPHGTTQRTGGIGLARFRKEGFISLRGPSGGGVVCTRRLRWPGGNLQINADARRGEIKVRVSDALRHPLPGFDYADCPPFSGDSVAHTVRWKEQSLASLSGRELRLEFFLRDADLYTFRALGSELD